MYIANNSPLRKVAGRSFSNPNKKVCKNFKVRLMIMAGRILVTLLIFIFSISIGCARQKTTSKAPDFQAKDIFGNQTISLSNYRGKAILLNFWATWCPPCIAEIPDLTQLYDKYKEKLLIIGVSLDRESTEVIRDFYKRFKMNYPVIMGTPEIVKSYGGISAIPTSFLINKKGEIVQKIVGYRSKDQYESYLLPLISEK